MNAIIGYSEMLQEEAEDLGQERFLPDLVKIKEAGKHLLSLINDILDLSKIEAGKMDVFIEDFEVADLIAQVQSVIEPLMTKNATHWSWTAHLTRARCVPIRPNCARACSTC